MVCLIQHPDDGHPVCNAPAAENALLAALPPLLRTRRTVSSVWIVLVVPFLCAIALMICQQYESSALQREGFDITRQVQERATQTYSQLSSMLGVHYATAGDQASLIAMAEHVRLHYPGTTAVGRYQNLSLMGRRDFPESELAPGRLDSRIAYLHGRQSVASPRRRHVSLVSILEPMSPQLLPLLGSDLTAGNALQARLASATAENSTVALLIPDDWPAARQLMLLQPAYRGRYVPQEKEERIRQDDGGYLLITDPHDLVEGVLDEKPHSRVNSLSLVLRENGQARLLANRQFMPDGLLGRDWFEPSIQQHSVALGDISLELVIENSPGIRGVHALMVVSFILLATTAFTTTLSWLLERQRVVCERLLGNSLLQIERERTNRTLHLVGDAVITVNKQGLIQQVNSAGVKFLGGRVQELMNKALDDHLCLHYRCSPSDQFIAQKHLSSMHLGEQVEHDLVIVNGEYSAREFHVSTSMNPGSSEHLTSAVFVFRETTSEVRLSAELEYQANHDALTGCINRCHFQRHLENVLQKRSAYSGGNALLYIDLDRFKEVNDVAGHSAGDMMLVQLTKELRKDLDNNTTFARLGGDKFGVLMKNVSPARAMRTAVLIYKRFQTMVFYHQTRGYPIRASLGLVNFDETGGSPCDVLAAADMACCVAKDLGRNNLHVYRADDEAITLRTTELQWLSILRKALEDDRFQLHAQPIVSTDSPEMCSHYELLLRLTDEHGNDLEASRIIRAAERYGMMCDIDRWVINEALCIIAEHNEYAGQHHVTFAINLSGQSAADSTLIHYIKERILHYRVNPERLCFEITETAAISNFDNAVSLSKAIRGMGAQIALDDFGSGLSSFSYLKNLPIDVLKIDGQFILDIPENQVDHAMVKAIRDVAHSMQIITVAECVENRETLDVLANIGIDLAQGFHIGRPTPLRQTLSRRGWHSRVPSLPKAIVRA